MYAQAAYIVHVRSQQIDILRIILGDGEHGDKTIGSECDQLIFEQIDEHDGCGHRNDFGKTIVKLRIFWIQADFVALLHQTVAAHYNEIVPPK